MKLDSIRTASLVLFVAVSSCHSPSTASAPAPPADFRFVPVDLGTLGTGLESRAFGIDDLGNVVGESRFVGGSAEMHAFFWSNGVMLDLGTLPGGGASTAHGINVNRDIVGSAENSDGVRHAVVWHYSGSTFTISDLGVLPGGTVSEGLGIAPRNGRIVGYSTTMGPTSPHAVQLAGNSPLMDLGTLPGTSSSKAFAVNSRAWVVGQAYNSDGDLRAFLRDGTLKDLGALGGTASSARAISENGYVTGGAELPTTVRHPFLLRRDRLDMRDLGMIEGWGDGVGYGVNQWPWVIGQAIVPGGYSGFIWTPANGMRDLNKLIDPSTGWELRYPRAINARGQVTGWGVHDGQVRAFLLTPVPVP